MTIIKYFLALILTFMLTFTLTFLIYYENIKNETIEIFKDKSDNVSLYLKDTLQKAALDNDFKTIESSLKTLSSMQIFKSVELRYKTYYFSKEALIINSKNMRADTLLFSDVTTDYKNGKIDFLDDNQYVFIPNKEFDIKEPLVVKFQALKDGKVYNSTAYLKFYMSIDKSYENNNSTQSLFESFIDSEDLDSDRVLSITYKNKSFAHLKYRFNQSYFIKQIKLYIEKIFIYSISLFLITIIILYGFYYIVLRKDIGIPIERIGVYIDNILENKYIQLEHTDSKLMSIDKIYAKLQILSKKFASVTNELNINKDILERKNFIDDLTGLPNKKVFEKDLKTMFVTNNTGFIILSKIYNLGQFTTEHGSNDANHLIEDFSQHLLEVLKKYNRYKSTVYRFYGAEFSIVIDLKDIEVIKVILTQITQSLEGKLKEKYHLQNSVAHFGAVPFDNYGTIDSILHNAHESYLKALEDKSTLFNISNDAEIIQKAKENEDMVKDIITKENFTVKFLYDTFDIDEDKKIIMQDASPIIFNALTSKRFPIGIFISVAEKLNLSATFDKLMIEKVLEHLKSNMITHKVAISLSMMSLTDRKFLSWLEGILLYNKSAVKNLVFSITSYNAKAHLEEFNSLVEILHSFDSKILLKRFSLDDFFLDELDDLKIDYIRLSKEYCTDINKDRLKKHSVKDIILYGELNDIYVLGDSIISEDDYKTISRLGINGTSR